MFVTYTGQQSRVLDYTAGCQNCPTMHSTFTCAVFTDLSHLRLFPAFLPSKIHIWLNSQMFLPLHSFFVDIMRCPAVLNARSLLVYYGLDGSGFESRWGRDFALGGPEDRSPLGVLCNGTGSFSGGKDCAYLRKKYFIIL